LKNLDSLNPAIAQPRTFSSIVALLPFLLGILCIPLASAAAPSLPFSKNFLAVLCAVQSVLSLFLMIIPKLYHWDWRSKYFGVPLLYVGSTGLIGIVPWLGIVFFSNLPTSARFLLFATYTASVVWWCRRFVTHYRFVFANSDLRHAIYEEDIDAIYYLQQADKILLEEKRKLAQFPSSFLFVFFMALAFLTIPYAAKISNWVGTPFIHIFLIIATLPIVLMCLGLAVRGYLVFYYYPWRLKRQTGKDVYVIMGGIATVKDELT
jgi:uncharacterized Tic20 family protein